MDVQGRNGDSPINPAPLGLLIKSYREDFALAQRLMASLDRFNVEHLPTWVVVPESDVELFRDFESQHVTVLPETVLGQYLVDSPVHGIRPGYINQEIIKLAFWELGLVENYFPIDSDAVMLRDFGFADLMWDSRTPYTVLVEDHDLKVDPDYYRDNWQGREQSLRRIQELVELEDRRILTCHGHQVLSSQVIESLKANFMNPRDWTYSDLLEEAPYEFSWYNFWLQKDLTIPIYLREPFMKVAHSPTQHLELALRGITPMDLARGYLGVIINSNFAKSWGGDVSAQETPAETIARYLTWSQLVKTATTKFRSSVSRRFSRHG